MVVAIGLAAIAGIFYLFLPVNRGEIPCYFGTAERAKPFPPIVDSHQFSNKSIAEAYHAAKTSPDVLAQQPCLCHCGRKMGHCSPLDCFAGKHAAECDVRVKEAIFAIREQQGGKSAAQIRAEIIKGDCRTVQL